MRIDRVYYQRRLCEELEATAHAGHLRTASIHRELARRYKALLDSTDGLDEAADKPAEPLILVPSTPAPA